MNTGRIWFILFILFLLNYICKIVLNKKKIDRSPNRLFDKIIIISLPVFGAFMWKDSAIAVNTKIANTLIGLASFAAGLWLYILKKGRR